MPATDPPAVRNDPARDDPARDDPARDDPARDDPACNEDGVPAADDSAPVDEDGALVDEDGAPVEGDGGRAPLVRATEHAAQANLRTMLELCASGRLRCSAATRRPSAATVRAISEHLVDGDFYPEVAIQAFAWPLLVQAAGLVTLDGTKLTLTAKGRSAQRKTAPTIRLLWQRWLTKGVIDEFSRIDAIKGQRARNALSAVSRRRGTVAIALQACEPGEWIPVDELFRTMQQEGLDPTVERNERALWKLYLDDPIYGSFGYAGFHDWALLEGRYTLAVLFEYAATLGMIDVEYTDPVGARDDFRGNWGADGLAALSRYDGLLAIRVNPLGEYVLGHTQEYEAVRVGPGCVDAGGGGAGGGDAGGGDRKARPILRILSNGDIVATGELSMDDELVLSAFARRTNDRVWAVTADTLLAAVDSGRTLASFVEFATVRSDASLPTTVSTLINDVSRRCAQLVDRGHRWMISCPDPALIALIAHDKTLKSLCEPLGDTHLAVDPGAEATFRAALRRLGYVVPRAGSTVSG